MLRNIKRSLIDVLQLPTYWKHGREVRGRMSCSIRRFAYGPHPRQYYLLLEPEGFAPTAPLSWAFYLHGGAWTFGTPEAFRPAARPWLAQGFRVVLPSYRRPPRYSLPSIVADCKSVIAAVAASGMPLSPPQIGGISAGGHLAALMALHPDWWTAAGWPAGPDRALLCAAPLNLELLRPGRLFRRYADHDPINKLHHAGSLDWLLLHGTADGMVDYRHSTSFALRVPDARLLTIPEGGHLDAGRWTYDDRDPYAGAIADFIRSAAPAPPGPA
ncbi:dipeptidyl aminopeptidase/acylaminoacyl peptidase [Lewinella aquimaris]|uniref:Dipeptidyl aminopeptidase/acylaminoacyl peptidase n=1 Tax=Neolewinella aquimaris TaxID=1835722 RepID=A0A840E3N9_9BACT|nr:alpha/beta hydrolase [Neolewinella aquimaris]MBB4079811.1 dipeptidyl aminopeptidase/acylaminoacyl peptidase [Neolewinella aquimaris]